MRERSVDASERSCSSTGVQETALWTPVNAGERVGSPGLADQTVVPEVFPRGDDFAIIAMGR